MTIVKNSQMSCCCCRDLHSEGDCPWTMGLRCLLLQVQVPVQIGQRPCLGFIMWLSNQELIWNWTLMLCTVCPKDNHMTILTFKLPFRNTFTVNFVHKVVKRTPICNVLISLMIYLLTSYWHDSRKTVRMFAFFAHSKLKSEMSGTKSWPK